MIQLSSLMWATAVFFAVIGFLRGWNREVVATAGSVLGLFVMFQVDSILRSTLFLAISRTQIFFVQAAIFLAIVFFAFRMGNVDNRRDERSLQTGILGGFFGFINGYLIAGVLWYFMDINEYPLDPFIIAPSLTSQSAQALESVMPVVLLSGGISGTGDLLTVIVLILFFVVIAVAA